MIIQCDDSTVVSLCDCSGIAVRPWVEAGFRGVCVDLSLRAGVAFRDGIEWVGADVRTVGLRGRPEGVCAFPPCTHLSAAGAGSWDRKGPGALLEALSIADACLRLCERSRARWWFVENPSGRLSQAWGPADVVFSPHEFGGYLSPPGDAYTKRTCLWSGGAFALPPRRELVPVEGSLVEAVEDVGRRSETPRGFARAVFESLSPASPFLSKVSLFPRVSLPAPVSCRPGGPLRPPARRPCAWCGRSMLAARTDQRFCRTTCRVSAFRAARSSLIPSPTPEP